MDILIHGYRCANTHPCVHLLAMALLVVEVFRGQAWNHGFRARMKTLIGWVSLSFWRSSYDFVLIIIMIIMIIICVMNNNTNTNDKCWR